MSLRTRLNNDDNDEVDDNDDNADDEDYDDDANDDGQVVAEDPGAVAAAAWFEALAKVFW